MIRGSECQRIAPLYEASYERHALRLAAALSSVYCNQKDSDQNKGDTIDAGRKVKDENIVERDVVTLVVKGVASMRGRMTKKRG